LRWPILPMVEAGEAAVLLRRRTLRRRCRMRRLRCPTWRLRREWLRRTWPRRPHRTWQRQRRT
jgi:hypothetical protein